MDERLAGMSAATPIDDLEVVGLDFETTGLGAWTGDQVCEVGLVLARGSEAEVLLSTFVDPGKPIPPAIQEITGIKDDDVSGAPDFGHVLPRLLAAIGDRPLVIHNAPFDLAFVQQGAEAYGLPMIGNLTIDTLLLSRFLTRGTEPSSLGKICDRLGIDRGRSHRAADDALASVRVFDALGQQLERRDVKTIGDLVRVRIAGPAPLFANEPSSVLLDLLSISVQRRAVVGLDYASYPGAPLRRYRVRCLQLMNDRDLVVRVLEGPAGEQIDVDRAFDAQKIMILQAGERTFWSPWLSPSDS